MSTGTARALCAPGAYPSTSCLTPVAPRQRTSRPPKTVLKFLGMGRRGTAGLFLWVSDTRPSPKLGAFAPLSHVHWTCSCALRTGGLPFDVVPDARGAKAANLKAV